MRYLFFCLCAVPALAGEYAILSNGFRLHAERHEASGDVVRLYMAEGVVEFPKSQVTGFEREEFVPPPPPAPKAAIPKATPEAAESVRTPHEIVDQAADNTSSNPRF